MKFQVKEDGKRLLVICVAATIMALNIKTFVRTGGLYPGGATGLTILIQHVAEVYFHIVIPYTVVNILLNAVPVYIGFRFIGKKFTMYSCLMIVLTGFLTDIIPAYVITYDTLLISVFGGIINGVAISLCLSVDATSGGTDFIAIYMSDKKGMDSWNMRNIARIVGADASAEQIRLLDLTDAFRDVADPWYTGDFDQTYADIEKGCEALLEYLLQNM